MARPTLESIEKAQQRVDQAKARLQALQARASALDRKADARRKIILGGLLLGVVEAAQLGVGLHVRGQADLERDAPVGDVLRELGQVGLIVGHHLST